MVKNTLKLKYYNRREEMTETIENFKKGIMEMVPQVPYVIDQIGEAMNWVTEEVEEGAQYRVFKTAYEVAQFAKAISEPNFFKTHLIITSLLSALNGDITKKERFAKFDTASKAVEKSWKELKITEEEVEKHGCFKSLLFVRPVEITGTVGTWGIEGSVDVPGITVVEDPRKVDVPGKMVGRNTGEWVLLMLGAGVASFVCTTITTTDAHINISKQQEIQVSKINRLSDPEAGIDISATPSSYQHANTQ